MRWMCLFLLALVSVTVAHAFEAQTLEPGEDPAFFADVPDSAIQVHVELGEKRLSNQAHIFTTIPEQLRGRPAISPHRGPSTSKPGPGYSVTVNRPAALYLAVHHRGQPAVPEAWKLTGLTLGWGGHEDNIYVQIVEPGRVTVPEHDGKAGGYGVPHMLIASDDLDTARALIDNPVQRKTAIVRPARVAVVLPDPKQPGLYGHPGDTLRWKLRVIRGSAGIVPDAIKISVQEQDGEFTWSTEATLDANGHTDVLSLAPPRIGFYKLHVEAEPSFDLTPVRGGLGIVPEPAPVSQDSPWGVMRVARAPFEAPLARMLGVDWVRHSNWNMVTPKPDGNGIDPGQFKVIADEYSDQGIHIMASISLVPPALSSRPDDTSQSGDAGPLHSRVAPRDWDEWQTFMRDLTASLPEIDYWEIGNEPNTPHHYWAGTVEEFTELLKRSAAGIREAKPDATILTSGFTLNPDAATFFDRMLELGAGPSFDVLTVHSLYAKAVSVDDMRQLLKKHGLDATMPVWSTEPKHVLPMRNFEAGVEKNMHFMLVNPGAYGAFQALAERDGAATRWGVAFAIASDSIGNARYAEPITTGLPDVELARFERSATTGGTEQLLVATADAGPRGSGVRVKVRPLPGETATYVDLMGNREKVSAGQDFVLPLDRDGVLFGAAALEVQGIDVGEDTGNAGIEVIADKAELQHGFVPRSEEDRPHYAVVYKSPAELSGEQPTITFPFEIEKPGTHEFFISATWYPSHAGNLISPFSWSVDGKSPQRAPAQTSLYWRRSTREHLRFGELPGIPTPDTGVTSSHTLAKLGTLRKLDAGPHTLSIKLEAPRSHDQHFSMEVELVAVRWIKDDRE